MGVKYKAKSKELGRVFCIRWAQEVAVTGDQLTMEDIYAMVAKDFGVTVHVMRSIRQGARVCSQELAERIAGYFQVSLKDIFEEHLSTR